jgi:23S rRNA-/tRNA-specific pseudouridylate synthase
MSIPQTQRDKLIVFGEDKNCRYLWKPAWIASTFGNSQHYLALLESNNPWQKWTKWTELVSNQWDSVYEKTKQKRPRVSLNTITPYQPSEDRRLEWRIKKQKELFSSDHEYWLLNRLDTDTSWYLYFAKNITVYAEWATWQEKGLIEKIYMWCVENDMTPIRKYPSKDPWLIWDEQTKQVIINRPILHHKHLADRMIVWNTRKKIKHNRGHPQEAETKISYLQEEPTLVTVTLRKGKRHQIRVHLATAWYPLVWDPLYGNRDKGLPFLHLRSMGVVWNMQ